MDGDASSVMAQGGKRAQRLLCARRGRRVTGDQLAEGDLQFRRWLALLEAVPTESSQERYQRGVEG